MQLLRCYLRPAELGMRAPEEPLRSDLDVAGIKAQVLRRIVKLEERERKREELLAEVTAMAEEHGLDAGALKAVMGEDVGGRSGRDGLSREVASSRKPAEETNKSGPADVLRRCSLLRDLW